MKVTKETSSKTEECTKTYKIVGGKRILVEESSNAKVDEEQKDHQDKSLPELERNNHEISTMAPKNAHFENLTFHKIHTSIKFIFDKIHYFKISFSTKFAFLKSHIWENRHLWSVKPCW